MYTKNTRHTFLCLMILLIVLTGCASTNETHDTAHALLEALSVPPQPPSFPVGLDWQYDVRQDRYTLDEDGLRDILAFRDDLYGAEGTHGYVYDYKTWFLAYMRTLDKIRRKGL